MLILATVLADLYDAGSHVKRYGMGVAAILVVGIILAFWLPVSKNRVSMSYVLISLGVSGVLFGLMIWLKSQPWLNSQPWLAVLTGQLGLAAWGKNPLALYLLHLVVLGLFALPPVPNWYAAAPGWLVLCQAAFLIIILGWVAKRFEARKIFFSI